MKGLKKWNVLGVGITVKKMWKKREREWSLRNMVWGPSRPSKNERHRQCNVEISKCLMYYSIFPGIHLSLCTIYQTWVTWLVGNHSNTNIMAELRDWLNKPFWYMYFPFSGTNTRRNLIFWKYNSSGCLTTLKNKCPVDTLVYSGYLGPYTGCLNRSIFLVCFL